MEDVKSFFLRMNVYQCFVVLLLLVIASNKCNLINATRTDENNPKNYIPMEPMHTFRSPYDRNRSANSVSHLSQEYHYIQEEKYRALHYVEPVGGEAWWDPFDEVEISYPIPPEMAVRVKEKYIVGPRTMKHMGEKFIMYAAGIANEPEFEEEMGALNISVHAFDCTIPADSKFKNNVQFHHWCLGRDSGFENNIYASHSSNKTFVFRSLSETKKLLGHSHVHVLKMDIEGYEWDILQKDIIENPNSEDLPDQILVEIHAIGANPHYVPTHLSQDKTRARVSQLVLGLWKRGYRVVDKVINFGDRHCSDFTFLRIYD